MKETFHSPRGFTMIEMVMVMIVLAIVATYVYSQSAMSGNEVIAQAETLKSHLRFAQVKAMNDSVPWGIHIPNATSYILYKDNAQAAGTLLPGENGQTHTLPAGVTVASGIGTTINFDSWGSPGTSTLTIALSPNPGVNVITITKNTGYIP